MTPMDSPSLVPNCRKRSYEDGPCQRPSPDAPCISPLATVGTSAEAGSDTMKSTRRVEPPPPRLTPRGYVATLDLRLQRLEHLLDDLLSKQSWLAMSSKGSGATSDPSSISSPTSSRSPKSNCPPQSPLPALTSPSTSSSAPTSPLSPASSLCFPVTPRFPHTALKSPSSVHDAASASVIEGIEQEAAGVPLPPLPFKLESKFLLSEIVLGGWQCGPITREERAQWGLVGDIAAKQGFRLEG